MSFLSSMAGIDAEDPASNAILGFDISDNTPVWFTIGSGLSYDHSTHTLSATGSGGGIGGSIAANQIAYGTGTNTIAGNATFLYNPAGIFAVGFGSDFVLNFHGNGTGNSYDFGDLDGLSTGIAFLMDEVVVGSTWQASISDNNGIYFEVSQKNGVYQLGDISGVKNSSYLNINDTSKFASIFVNGLQALKLDAFTDEYLLGLDGQGNSTNININDGTRTAIINAANGLILNYLGGAGDKGLAVNNLGKVVSVDLTQVIYTAKVTIPTAQVLTLNSIPVQLVPAPAAGLAIVPVSITVKVVFNTTAYSVNTTLSAYTVAGPGAYMSNLLSLQDTTSTIRAMVQSAQNQVATATALMLTVSGGNPIAGNSDIIVEVNYMLMTP